MCATLRWDGKLSQLTGRMSAAGEFGSEQYLEPEYWAYTPRLGHATGWDTQLGPRQAAIVGRRFDRARTARFVDAHSKHKLLARASTNRAERAARHHGTCSRSHYIYMALLALVPASTEGWSGLTAAPPSLSCCRCPPALPRCARCPCAAVAVTGAPVAAPIRSGRRPSRLRDASRRAMRLGMAG